LPKCYLRWDQIVECQPYFCDRIAIAVTHDAIPRARLNYYYDPDAWGPVSKTERRAAKNALIIYSLFMRPNQETILSKIRAGQKLFNKLRFPSSPQA
jgi:hypothetical protein